VPSQTRLTATSMLPRVCERPRLRRSTYGNVHDSLGKGLRRFLWEVVPDASRDLPVLVFPREFLCVRRGIRVRRTVGVAFHRNGRDGDDRALREPVFQIIVFRLALSQAQLPAVIVDHDIDVIRVVEGGSAAIEHSVVELPLWGSELPDQLRKFVPVFFVADTATVTGKIELVPPFELGPRRQRLPAS
jgi:hypothetical protein